MESRLSLTNPLPHQLWVTGPALPLSSVSLGIHPANQGVLSIRALEQVGPADLGALPALQLLSLLPRVPHRPGRRLPPGLVLSPGCPVAGGGSVGRESDLRFRALPRLRRKNCQETQVSLEDQGEGVESRAGEQAADSRPQGLCPLPHTPQLQPVSPPCFLSLFKALPHSLPFFAPRKSPRLSPAFSVERRPWAQVA